MYADEDSITGSMAVFIALHAVMLEREVMALCSYTRAPSSSPQLVVLLPQQEQLDEFDCQASSLFLD